MSEPPLRLPRRESDSHKGSYGGVMLVGGSRGMSGSIALASIGALRTGSGLVSALVPDRCLETVAGFHPGVMTIPGDDDHEGRFAITAINTLSRTLSKTTRLAAVGCGPGMTSAPGSIAIVQRLLQATKLPRVLDADAINVLPNTDWEVGEQPAHGTLILTPHPGEFERLTGVSATDRDAQSVAAAELASRTGATIVLKGGPSIVFHRDQSWTNTTGNPGMASAGSGDVLTGVITSLLGQGLTAWDAARLGCWLHGLAGDLAASKHGQAGMTCTDLLAELGTAIQSTIQAAKA